MKCFPRIEFGRGILWEPIQLRPSAQEHHTGEWMYEIEAMAKQDKEAFSGNTLLSVFHMVDRASAAEMQTAVQSIREEYADSLTDADMATLDHLLSRVPLTPSRGVSFVTQTPVQKLRP